VSTEQGREAPSPNEPRVIHVEGVQAAQVGDYNVQYVYNHNYGPKSWTDSPGQLPADDAGSADGSPYRGLRAFELRDAPFFFGRDQAVDELMSTLDEHARGTGLVVVSGASGAGKSSLLRAGMLPRIRRDGLASMPGSSGWPCLLLTPGNAPLDELAVQVATLAGTDAGQAVRGLAADPGRFAYSARQAALTQYQGPGPARLVLVIDQFEHLFTQCQDSAQRRGYVAALHAAATGGGSEPAALIVLGVRAEFEARCAEFPELSDAINHHRLLTAMTERELRLAITGPAGKAGADVEEALVNALLAEIRARSASSTGVATAAGALPLLSYALDQTWRRRAGSTLTLADYEHTGGIETAVAESAQHAYDGLSPAQRGTARQVFLRLTAVSDDGGTDTAVPASRAELMAGKDPADVQAVLDAFAEPRLLTLDADTVQISHEVLLTAWPLFRDDWLAQTRDDRVILSRLRVAAGEWVNSRRDRSYLYSGIVLASATAVAGRHPLTDNEREFLRASVRASQRRTQLLLGAVAVLTALVVALGAVTLVAFNAKAQSSRERDQAVAGELADQSEALGDQDPVLARLEAVAAWRIRPSDQAAYAMRSAAMLPGIAVLPGTQGTVEAAAFSTNGRMLAVGTANGDTQLWNNASHLPIGRPLRIAGSGQVMSVAFSPDGRELAVAADEGTQLWNVAAHRLLGLLAEHGDEAAALAFSPNGDTLAVATVGGGTATFAGVQLWNVASRRPGPLIPVSGGADSVAFSPDGQTIAIGAFAGATELQQLGTDRSPTVLATRNDSSLAFSPDGRTLLAGGALGAEWWNISTQQQIGQMSTHASYGTLRQAAAFSPNGKILAVMSQDESLQLWGIGANRPISIPFTSPGGAEPPLAFSHDGGTLAAGVGTGVALVDVAAATGTPAATLPANTSLANPAISPFGTVLSVDPGDNTVQMRSTATGKPVGVPLNVPGLSDDPLAVTSGGTIMAVGTIKGVFLRSPSARQLSGVPLPGTSDALLPAKEQPDAVEMAFSPDGAMLAVVLRTGALQLWELSKRTLVKTIGGGCDGPSFTPDGKLLVATCDSGLQLFDAATGKPITTISGQISGVVFSPNGTLLAATTLTNIQLWTVGPSPRLTDTLPARAVASVAFSPDASVLAVGFASGTLLYDVGTGQKIGPSLPNHSSEQGIGSVSVVWTANGTTLGATTFNGPTELWHVGYLQTAQIATYLCALAGHTLSPGQWRQYGQGVPYRNVCP
jgi:WD40 repeat protein